MPKPYKTITLRLNADEYAHLQAQANARGEATRDEITEAARLVRQMARLVRDTL